MNEKMRRSIETIFATQDVDGLRLVLHLVDSLLKQNAELERNRELSKQVIETQSTMIAMLKGGDVVG